jgi:hypothetical protein
MLAGAKEVPPVKTKAKGEASFTLNPKATSITYSVTVSGLPSPTAAHIHMGAPGKNGPPVVILYPTASGAAQKGNVLAKGVITASSLVGPLKGKPLSDLLRVIRSGDVYVNVHTTAHSDGEIRGWIARTRK